LPKPTTTTSHWSVFIVSFPFRSVDLVRHSLRAIRLARSFGNGENLRFSSGRSSVAISELRAQQRFLPTWPRCLQYVESGPRPFLIHVAREMRSISRRPAQAP
jgi:hypothetical protein